MCQNLYGRYTMKQLKGSLIFRLLSELLIVFLGVYLAFLFNAHGEKVKDKARQAQLIQGLHKEIEYFLGGANRRSPVMEDAFKQWKIGLADGQVQTPLYFKLEGHALPNSSMWQVVMFFDGIQLLDVSTMFELSKYYNHFDIMLSKYIKLIEFAEAEIIPYQDTPSHFYRTKGDLTARYEAYLDRYTDFLDLFHGMIKESETMLHLLEPEWKRLGVDLKQQNPESTLQ